MAKELRLRQVKSRGGAANDPVFGHITPVDLTTLHRLA
jgi:hypothetical protein